MEISFNIHPFTSLVLLFFNFVSDNPMPPDRIPIGEGITSNITEIGKFKLKFFKPKN